MKGKYPFNLTNSEDIIKNIKNGKEIPVNKNNVFSYYIISSLKDYYLNEDYIKLEIKFSQNFMTKEDKNYCIKNQGSICHIKFGDGFLTGFFCKVNHKSIPFKRALITYKYSGQKSLIINYLKDNKMIEKTVNLDDRKNIIIGDILFIELFEKDDIKNFFELDEKNLKEAYESNDIFLLQYEVVDSNKQLVKNFSFSSGKIEKYRNGDIFHDIPTLMGAMGSPIILRNNKYYLIGIHLYSMQKHKNIKIGKNFHYILKDI